MVAPETERLLGTMNYIQVLWAPPTEKLFEIIISHIQLRFPEIFSHIHIFCVTRSKCHLLWTRRQNYCISNYIILLGVSYKRARFWVLIRRKTKKNSDNLPNDFSIFQAEIFAIKGTLELLCKEAIQVLSVNRRVYIYWVQGDTGIGGNVIADELAKEGVFLEHSGRWGE